MSANAARKEGVLDGGLGRCGSELDGWWLGASHWVERDAIVVIVVVAGVAQIYLGDVGGLAMMVGVKSESWGANWTFGVREYVIFLFPVGRD